MPAALVRVAPVAAIALLLLAGCTPEEGASPEPEPTVSTEAPTPEATDDAVVGTPVGATCDDLVSADALYAYNPNFAAIANFTPDDGTAAASAVAYQGVACRWENLSSGDQIDVSVAQLDDDTLTALKNAAFEDSEMVPTYGEEAYFTVDGGTGSAQVFLGPFWVVAESAIFYEPGDATEIVESVLAALS